MRKSERRKQFSIKISEQRKRNEINKAKKKGLTLSKHIELLILENLDKEVKATGSPIQSVKHGVHRVEIPIYPQKFILDQIKEKAKAKQLSVSKYINLLIF